MPTLRRKVAARRSRPARARGASLGPQTQTAVHLRLSVKIVPVNDLGQMANEVIE